MKIGTNFWINGVKWTINKLRSRDCNCPNSLGTESLKESLIVIFDVDREQTQVENDLCHEVVHAILDSNCIDCGDEITVDEHFVQLMANGVHQFMQSVVEWQK